MNLKNVKSFLKPGSLKLKHLLQFILLSFHASNYQIRFTHMMQNGGLLENGSFNQKNTLLLLGAICILGHSMELYFCTFCCRFEYLTRFFTSCTSFFGNSNFSKGDSFWGKTLIFWKVPMCWNVLDILLELSSKQIYGRVLISYHSHCMKPDQKFARLHSLVEKSC